MYKVQAQNNLLHNGKQLIDAKYFVVAFSFVDTQEVYISASVSVMLGKQKS